MYAKFVRGMKASLINELAVMFVLVQRDIKSVTWSIFALVRLEAGMDPVYSCLGISKKEIQTRAASVPDLDW